MSAVAYLNSVEGGQTLFPLVDLSLVPEAGKLVLFPSSYPWLHHALAPDGGAKYSMVTWFNGY